MYSRATLARGGLVGLVILAGLVTDGFSTSDEVRSLDPATPEGAVQNYLDAVLRGDTEGAAHLFAAESGCDLGDLQRAYVGQDAYVVLEGVGVEADTAHVDVSITTGSSNLVPTQWSEDRIVRLVRAGDTWRITGSPWPMFDCGGEVP